MALLKREEILSAVDRPVETVSVPEWGGEVLVQGLTGVQRDDLETSIITTNGKKTPGVDLHNLRAKLCALCMVDEAGKRLFPDADVRELGRKSASALQRVFEVAQRLSGLSNADVEELTKNSTSDQSEGSTSG
jgi:hypothetical protein